MKVFRERLFLLDGSPAVGAIVEVYDCEQRGPIAQATTDAIGVWEALAPEESKPPFFRVVWWNRNETVQLVSSTTPIQ